ncbi:hypothetical protein BGX26_002843 [Mortierella sp. AD094]|nr:hypothetical protein BGX26_002843 [Mortierella sp. AD094]
MFVIMNIHQVKMRDHARHQTQTAANVIDYQVERLAEDEIAELLSSKYSWSAAAGHSEHNSALSDSEQRIPSAKRARLCKCTVNLKRSSEVSKEDDPTMNLAHFETLNQETTWVCGDVDLVKEFSNFRMDNLGPYSLARDGIADLTFGRIICCPEGRTCPCRDTTKMAYLCVNKRSCILGKLLRGGRNGYQEGEYDRPDRSIPLLNNHVIIPEHINEREGFLDLAWSFIRGALTLSEIESRYLEVLVTGVEARNNIGKDLLTDTKDVGQFCDGLAFKEGNQVCLAKASIIFDPNADKKRADEFKLARELRDSWAHQIKQVSRESVPPRGLKVFGSCSCKDETRLWQLDFQGTFRLKQFGLFVVPLAKRGLGKKMKAAVRSCLELAIRIEADIKRREDIGDATFEQLQELHDAFRQIFNTTPTPTKILKREKN